MAPLGRNSEFVDDDGIPYERTQRIYVPNKELTDQELIDTFAQKNPMKGGEQAYRELLVKRPNRFKNMRMVYTEREMDELGIPLQVRNNCAHLWLEQRLCYLEHHYLPWHCGYEKARFRRCEYKNRLKGLKRSQRLIKEEKRLKILYDEIEKRRIAEIQNPQQEMDDDDDDDSF